MHEKFLTGIQVNIFAVILLMIIIVNIRKRPDRSECTQKLYWGMVLGNLTMIVVDIAVSVLNGKETYILRQMHIFIETMDYMLAPVVGLLWALYVEVKVKRGRECIRRALLPLSIPVILNVILLTFNQRNGVMFYIDKSNIYHRGELFIVSVVLTYIYLVYAFIKTIKNRRDIRHTDYYSLLLFPLPPFVGGLIQTAYYGVTLMWTSMAISMLVIFINIQNDQLNRDHLTGLYNRRQMEKYISNYINGGYKCKMLGGIMIDVNEFKKINDEYGHVEGDRALECLGEILLKSFRREDFLARYAGDEFVVLSKVADYRELESMIERLHETVESFNRESSKPYDISISVGYDILDSASKTTSELFIEHIDDLMYKNKKVSTV